MKGRKGKNKRFLKGAVFIFVLTLIWVSCSDRPSNVLSEDKMVDLLVDMEIAEAYANTQTSTTGSEKLEMGKRVLEAHGVSKETLDTTLAWYGRNMDDYSELFEKVDKEILKRRKKYTEIPGEGQKEPDNLWPYNTHLVVSPLSGADNFSFTLPNPETEKGEILTMSFYLSNPVSFKGTLGVEYTDGYGEAAILNSNGKNRVQVELQTDTSKRVERIFGTMHLKDTKDLPLFIDSIALKGEPLDTLNYRSKRRSQKSFGVMRQQKVPEKKKETNDEKEEKEKKAEEKPGFEKLQKNN